MENLEKFWILGGSKQGLNKITKVKIKFPHFLTIISTLVTFLGHASSGLHTNSRPRGRDGETEAGGEAG